MIRPCDVCGDEGRYCVSSVANPDPRVVVCWPCHDAGFADELDRGVDVEALRRRLFDRRIPHTVPQARDAGPLFTRRTA